MTEKNEAKLEGLYQALGKMFDKKIVGATSQVKALHGGTVGEVRLVEGIAITDTDEEIAYKLVHKIQKKWERHMDPNSWLREYDLYQSKLGDLMTDDLRWPTCYHSEKTEDQVQLWMEHIDGVTGHDLTLEMFEAASKEIGRFQGRLLKSQSSDLKALSNLSHVSMIKDVYKAYAAWPETYDYVRSTSCELPDHICKMIIENDEHATSVWQEIEKLPVIFSHRDYWVTNIFYVDGTIRLIDWDTSGWGTIGEDIASLIVDETSPDMLIDYYKTCLPAYKEGLSDYIDMSMYKDLYIFEQILFFFGYRLVEGFKFSKSQEGKNYNLAMLEKLYELRSIK